MTREEAGRLWTIIKAYSEGKQIEFKDLYNGKWYLAKNPNFTNAVNTYRIKEEPIYRPFKDARECCEEMKKHEPVGWIKSSTGILCNVLEIEQSGIVTKNSISGYATAINDFVFADGAPFGVKKRGLIMGRFRFRGKDVKSGEWVYGHLNLSYKASFIGDEDAYYINGREIDPNTIGQYVGLKDVNGKDIYEGDLLYIDEELPCVLVKWSYSDHGFAIFWHGDDIYDVRSEPLYCFDRWPMQIIGNIHEKDIQEKV